MVEIAPRKAESTELIDTGRLAAYLAKQTGGAPITVSEVGVVPGGFSKLTLIVKLGDNAALPGTIVLRLDRPAGLALGTEVRDEFAILQLLHARGVRVPEPFACEPTGDVLGAPFMAVAAVPGKTIGDMFNLPPRNPAINTAIATEIARMHAVPLHAVGGALRDSDKSTREQAAEWLDASRRTWEGLSASSAIIDAGFD